MSRNRQFPQKSKRRSPSKQQKQNMVVDVQNTQVVRVEPDTRKKFTHHDIKKISPLTDNQLYAFQEWAQGQNLVLEGFPGVGKSFLSLYMALTVVLDPDTTQNRIVIVRSATPTKDCGFLPGDLDEKLSVYETPYIQICDQLFKWKNSYNNLKDIGIISFESTSYLRGTSWDNSVIIFDEYPNGTESELTTVCTRVGRDSRIIISGDTLHQNDIGSKSGGGDLLKVLRKMDSISFIDFKIEDCVRSGFVREFLVAKYG